MNITIAGYNNPRTRRTLVNVEEAIAECGADVQVEWIDSTREMSEMGVQHTPAMFVDGEPKVAGRIPSVYEVKTWIEAVLEESVAA
jgi:protein-disulfide isomerase